MSKEWLFIACGFLTTILMLQPPLRAEHRVALLIGNDQYADDGLAPVRLEFDALKNSLARSGFRCEVLLNQTGSELRQAVEAFASSTPVRGTALIYYRGYLLPGDYKGEKGGYLAGTAAVRGDARKAGSGGAGVQYVLDLLHARGGSGQNLLIVSDAGGATFEAKMPADCLLGFTTQTLAKEIAARNSLRAAVASLKKLQGKWDSTAILDEAGSVAVSPPQKLIAGNKAGDEWVDGRGTVFCWCPPGKYMMGSPDGEDGRYPDEKLQQQTIEKGFWISKYEMTLHENLRNTPRSTLAKHKNDPLTMVNHDDAKRMLGQTLTNAERKAGRLPDGWEYGLPEPSEWEYAARAGTRTSFSFGDDVRQLPLYANFADKAYFDTQEVFSNYAHRTLSDGVTHLAMVGRYLPNPWGIHDMHGNVAEWCIDTSIRGGSWASQPHHCRSAHRDKFSSRNEQNFIGYRVVIRQK